MTHLTTAIPFETKKPETIPFELVSDKTKTFANSNAFSVVTAQNPIHPAVDVIATHSLTAIHAIYSKTLPPKPAVTKRARTTATLGTASVDVNIPTVLAANISAPYAAPRHITLNHADSSEFLPIVTPLIADAWEMYLRNANALLSFPKVPHGIRNGFDMGIKSNPSHTYVPPNHNSALAHPPAVLSYIQKELSLHRYTGPFSQSRLESIIGPFRTSPLGLVPKAGSSNEFRLIQDLSYPRNDPTQHSINSEIDIDDFRCDWGTFQQVASIVMDAPPFSEAATLDVDAAFRCCPITPSQQRNFVVMWEDFFYIDHNAPFGAVSSGGVFGHIADALMAIFRAHDISPAVNWVDDFLFFIFPINTDFSEDDNNWEPIFPYSLNTIFTITKNLGWPWKNSKTRPFNSSFKYLGFHWDLQNKTVEIPKEKKTRYLTKLEAWIPGKKFTRCEAESILGTLVHCSLALPTSRCHLSALSRFAASFTHTSSLFIKKEPNQSVLSDICWWREQLSTPFCGTRISRPPPLSPIQFWVDASTNWGIGVVFDNLWESWCLKPNWKANGRNIGWAEFVAIELGLILAISQGHSNTHFLIYSDNQGVIQALNGGKSRSFQQNNVLRRILLLLIIHSIYISSSYVSSNSNLADNPSRGIPPQDLTRISTITPLPSSLQPFLSKAVIK